ncbi:MAG: class II fumarate hydratase [Pseudomonadota bacterium]|nr:fumarate hydratase, class II [Gammaproteobacteria bacterium]MEC8858874.1 class II fumarate hydratase [Pseudomonadota bacterium]HBN15131.1 class II fumarate hydratase [Pseudohongiella sp.]|tara:strand:- start:1594 stop:2979 length:1386 start_codon:yes stop_codon:yes gene_type:complete
MKTRQERDSLGPVEVSEQVLWGAQTQRSLQNFAIGDHRFPRQFIHAFAKVKKAAASSNQALGGLSEDRARLIAAVCDEILQGRHDDQFPLSVWQTGSGTQTNMNLNEVIANRGNELAGHARGAYSPLHPNDHVNMSQSSNDVFPTVMHVVVAQQLETLIDATSTLRASLAERAEAFADILKSGRTHLMDATPITLGQEFSAYVAQLDYSLEQLIQARSGVRQLAIGGSAVGTGLNTHPDWASMVAKKVSELTGIEFASAGNKFMALAAHDALVDLHGRANTLATALFKIASDIRLMNSGPRCGLAEITIPANEPGSSIMPGKVNPTQAEALTMVCSRVMGNHTTVTVAASQGHFQLNVFKPVIIHALMESLQLLTDAQHSFHAHCVSGIQANKEQLSQYVNRSLMLVTALSPVIGYENAARAAKHANDHGLSLRESVVELELMSEAEFDRQVDARRMLGPE